MELKSKKQNLGFIFPALILAAALLLSFCFSGVFARGKTAEAFAAGTGEIISDGSFEEATATDLGDWVVYTASSQGAGGTVKLVTNADEDTVAYDGANAVHFEATSAQWPEIYQIIDVEPYTDYRITLRLQNNDISLTKQTNVFYGFANTDPANNVNIHQQQRWVDKSTKDFEEETPKHYVPMNATLNTGNYSKVRFFIRASAADIYIDEIAITKADAAMTPDGVNLLKQAGFEGTAAQLASVWKIGGTGNLEDNTFKSGYDDYKNDADYKAGEKIQNKEIEGTKCMWIAYYVGAESGKTIETYQEVTIEKNTYYNFYVNLSKFKKIGSAQIGFYVADGETGEMTKEFRVVTVQDSQLFNSEYRLFSVTLFSGENTKVRPFVRLVAGDTPSWAWGAGLLIDDCSFFATPNGTVPEGKTNLFADPDFEVTTRNGATSPWAFTGTSGEDGFNEGTDDAPRGFNTANDVWINHWNADGFSQLVELTAGKTYKASLRVKSYANKWWHIKGNFGIEVVDEEGESVAKAEFDVARDNDRLPTREGSYVANNCWLPISLTFKVEKTGEYDVGFKFFKNSNNEFYGGVDCSAPALYEFTEEQVDIDDPVLTVTGANVTLSGTVLTLNVERTATQLGGVLSINEPYRLVIADKNNAAHAGSDIIAADSKVLVYNGEELVATYTVKLGYKGDEGGGGGCGNMIAAFSLLGMLAAAFVVRKKI